MKRRVLSLIIALALCLDLFPAWALAGDVGTGGGLCPHHPEHTDACGYAVPVLGQECTHSHNDDCYIAVTECIHEHTADCYPAPDDASGAAGPALCAHVCTQDSGCVTKVLSCPHEHDGTCGYAAGSPGVPCTFVCPICPIEDLIGKLPRSVSMRNIGQVQAQLSEIYALYDELTADEQQQVDLSPCAALLDQIAGMETAALSDTSSSDPTRYTLDRDTTSSTPYLVSVHTIIVTNGYTLTAQKSSAMQVTGTGRLEIIGGAVISQNGAGVEVQSGGFLSITEKPGTRISGSAYALDIASGAEVRLSAGTYYGGTAAIRTADGDFDALLEPGYIYFDNDGNQITAADMAAAKLVTVGQCTDHSSKTYTHDAGATTHTWTCSVCKMTGPEPCTFDFAKAGTGTQDGTGTCACGNGLTVVVDEDDLTDLVYDGTIKPEEVKITVTLTDGSNRELVKGTDYTVVYEPRKDAGEITVTVTGITFNGTFTKVYLVEPDRPALEWDTAGITLPVEVDYDGAPVEASTPARAGDLPRVRIRIQSTEDDLQKYLQYSYKEQGGTGYTDGLPTNAGTYDVIVSLPEMQNFEAAVSAPITLVIRQISPIVTPPAATKPVYNGAVQALVTAGTLDPVAVRDGLEIQFSTNENGPFSATIPTGTDAGDSYRVWYKVAGLTSNYIAPDLNPAEVTGVEILRKPIKPVVTLSQYKYLYDGGEKEPTVTVMDEDHQTVLLDTEYQVEYQNNRNVGTAKVVVTDKPGGNYALTRAEVTFQITLRTQDALSITQKPNSVTYGDQFTLGTSGGSGNGLVTWEITSGANVAEVDPDSGQVTVIGDGSATVKATRSGMDPVTGDTNYEDATAVWTFTAKKKPVTANVTADDKTYDGNAAATVHAEVEQGVLAGDEIIINGLTGAFDNENAGIGKTVTVNTTGATISGTHSEHYDISYSSLTVKATIHKAVAEITAAPVPASLTYDGTAQELIAAGAVVDPAGVQVEYALSEEGPYSTDFPKGTNAGAYTVWYRIQETGNYTGLAPASVDVTISKKPVTPEIKLDQDTFVYDGAAKEPVVTLEEAGGTLIPANEYTVDYSGNINVGKATVTVTAKNDGNYSFTPDPVTKDFTISKKQAEVLTAPEAAGEPLTFNTGAQKLVTAGTGSGGRMVYSKDNTIFTAQIPTEINAGDYTVYYKVEGDANHSDSAVGQVDVTIAPKRVDNPTIELFDENDAPLVSYIYDGSAKEPKAVVKDGSTPIAATEYNIVYGDNKDAGRATVNITDRPNGNYTVTGSATFVIQKADIVFNPEPKAAVITYDGKPHELLVPGTTTGGTVQYALNSATSNYSDAIPTGINAGGYSVYYRVLGDKNHNDLPVQGPVDVTIRRKPLTDITIELTPDSFDYDGNVHLPAVAVKFKEGKTETVVPETEYDWRCSDPAPTNQGAYTITIADAAGGNYDLTGVTANTANFSIGKTAQAPLVIEDKPTTTIYGDTFTLKTSGGSSGSAVAWSVTGTAATVNVATGEVKITGVGAVTITATNPGDQNYLPVSDQWTFTAAPKPVTASIVVGNKPYDGTTAATVTSAGIAALSGDTVTIDLASITAVFDTPAAGTGKTVTLDTSKVKVTGADAAKYAISYPDTASADITKAMATITTDPKEITPLTYTGQPRALVTAGRTNVGFLVYSLDKDGPYSPEIPTGTNAGTYNVYYKVDETGDYTGIAVNAAPISVTIAPKTITPKVEPLESSFLYDGTKKEPKITVKDDKTVIDPDQYTVTWANDDPLVTDGLLTAAGTYTATITNVTNGNYSFTANARVEIKAAAQDALDITGTPDDVYYGDTIKTLKTTGGSGNGTVKWSITAGAASADIDPNTGVLTVKGTGTVTVTAERTVPNYAPATDTWTFTVKPKPVEAKVAITPKDYDGTTAAAVTASVKDGDLVDPADSFTINGLAGTYADANAGTGKTVTLDASKAVTTADTAKYAVSYPATAKGDINPRQVDVTVTLSGNDLRTDDTNGSYYYEYDGTDKTPAVTVTADDDSAVLAASDYSVSYANNKNVGDATVTVTAKAGGNYKFGNAMVKFAIRSARAALISSPQGKDLTYNGTAQELVTVGAATGGTVMYSESLAGPYKEDIPTQTAAGTYTVYYMVKGDANYEDTAPGQVSATIKPKEITPDITLEQVSYVYDGYPKTPTVTVKDGNDEILNTEYSVSYRDNVNAGTATVTVSDANGGNYIVNGTAVFMITKATPTVTDPAAITSLQYNGASQELVKAGVSSEGTVVYSLNGGNYSSAIPVGTAVGTYKVDWKVLGDANHSDTEPAALDVEIAKNTVAAPTITLSSNRFQFNGSQQKPTITVYDDHSRVIPEYEYTTTITGIKGDNMVDVDIYTIKITTPDTSNYIIKDDGTAGNTRTFEIVAADQEAISITGTKAQVYYGDTIQLGTTGGTGSGTISWTVAANDGGTVSSTISPTGLLTVKDAGVGPITVTVTRSKGGNYSDVSATWEFTAGKKPVTAVLTGVDKPFDGNVNATVKAKVDASDLAFGDTFGIPDLTGTFDNPNVGTNKTITLTGPAPIINDPKAANYEITFPAAATGSILAAAATVDTNPEAVNPLTYDASQAQALVTAGTATGGIMVYSLDGKDYGPAIPKAKDAGIYKVYYKVQGDGNHTDSEVGTVDVTIDKQTVTPQIELTPPSAQYDGSVKRPESVTVRDAANNVIPTSEYTVVYDSATNWKDVGKHKVKVQNVTGGNYIITGAEAEFEISTTAQAPLEIVNKPGLVYYGDTFTLSAVGGSGSSTVTWSSSDKNIADIDANGFVTIKGTGSATITAKKPGGTNYGDAEATYPLNALQKPVTAIVTAEDRVYVSGDRTTRIHVTWEKGALVGNDSIDTTPLSGIFADDQVGTDKTVTITGTPVSDATAQKYDITIPPTTTASILKADATAPTLTAKDRVYDGTTQDLVSGGDANTLYSASRDGVYSATVPTGTNAGTYTVWYKEKGDANHNDSEPQSIQVTITRKPLALTDANITVELSGNDLQTDTDGTYYYKYDGTEKKPTVTIKDGTVSIPASEYTVSYSDNKNVSTEDKKATATIIDSGDGNYIVNGSVTFEIRKGGAELTSSPQAKNLTYTRQPQELVTVGTATGGHIEYSLDNNRYSQSIPTETDAGTYTVYYKVVGDGNHEDDTTVGSVTVIIKPKEVISPKVTVSGTYTYDGTAKEPLSTDIEVKDGANTIPADEYEVTYRDNVNAGTATVIITNANGGNYIVNGTGTFEIKKSTASVATAPEGLENLPYNGTEQDLVKAGSASDGAMVYSLSETGPYIPAIPTGKAVDAYKVWYKVQGDSNHTGTEPQSVDASIVVNNVAAPIIQVTPPSVTYNGEKQEPTVTVKDDKGLVIDSSEYTVTYQGEDGNPTTGLTAVGTYTLTITGVANGNYTFDTTTGKNTATFTILPADQTPLTITGMRERVYYGDTIHLGTTGGNGTVTWAVSDDSIASIANGLLTIKGVGPVTVTATSTKPGYADQIATWSLYAERKPVTAVVTAAAKPYDGVIPATTTVTATLQTSDLVTGDVVKITLAGTFEDPNAGMDKKVKVDSTNPQFSADSKGQGNYLITYPDTTTASIFKAEITDVTAPGERTGLVYTGNPQALVTAGSSTEGTLEYSLDNLTYSASLPTGTGAGDYDVWYRVKGDGNHNDKGAIKLGTKVTIAPQEVTDPIIEFTPDSASYDGQVHKPAVTVKDANHRVIPAKEYTVSYGSSDWKTASSATVTHMVTIADEAGGNYNITLKSAEFTILMMGQNPLSIVGQPGAVQYGDTFTLSTSGGSGTGALMWTSSDKSVATIDQNGLVKVLKSGAATITATKQADGNYGAVSVNWSFSAEKRPVTAIVTAKDKEYDTTDEAKLDITWKDGDLLGSDSITLTLTGKFDNANVGTNKRVTIEGTAPTDDRYNIKIPSSTMASITPKAASVSGSTPTALTYTGSAQELVTGILPTNGDLAYSTDGSYYTLLVPTGTDAGTYPVWYKAQASGNYTDSAAVRVNVTINPKVVNTPTIELSPAEFEYDGAAKRPDVVVKDGNAVIPPSEYTVSYSNNVEIGTNATVTISDVSGGNYNVSGSKTFTIKAGAPALIDEPQPRSLTYNGRQQMLVTRGTAVNGRLMYSFDEYDDYSATIPKETDAGVYEVWYKVEGDDGTETEPESVIAEILPKQITPMVTLSLASDPLPFTGTAQRPPVTVVADGNQLTENVDYTVTYRNNINVGTATVEVQSVSGRNYQFYTTRTFEIAKAKAAFAVEPTGKNNLRYTGEALELFEAGLSLDGIVLYSKDTVTYTADIPTGINVGTHTFFAKVRGDSKHEDSDPIIIKATIVQNVVTNPTVTLSQSSFTYTGGEHKPAVTVTDDNGNVISPSEYTVTYSDNIQVGEATVTITSKGSNYSFTATAHFQITGAGQPALTITGKKDTVYYGDTLHLGTTGGSGTGTVTWNSSDGNVAAIDGSGVVKINKSGSVTITATKAASGSYGEATDTWTFYVNPKPVNAVVTAANKPYDGNNTATLTVTISSGLVGTDTFTVTATGHFVDENVGENKTVIITSLTVPDDVREKYDISCSPTTTASITPKPATVLDTDKPALAGSLTYNGSPQALLTAGGTADGGNLAYSVDGGSSYSYDLPTATNVGSYTVWYKVVASDENHKDSAPVKLGSVAIGPNRDTPDVLCVQSTFQYDGTEKTPTVVVRDSQQRIIPESEYTLELPTLRIAVGTYTVTVTDKPGGNYEFSGNVTGTFEIVAASQNPLSIITDKPLDVSYGETFRLSAMGGSGSGAIQWSIKEGNGIATIDKNGVVTVTGTGGFTVEAYREAADGYDKSNTASVPFEAHPKPVTPVVTAQNKPYDGTLTATLSATFKSGDLVGTDEINLTVAGHFATADVGTGKQVNITTKSAAGKNADKYTVTWPDTTTASIYRVNAVLAAKPAATPNLKYTGSAQELVTAGTTVNNIGVVEYSLSQNGVYSTDIPTGINVGTYKVWYRVADSVNYMGIPAAEIEVEIVKATPAIHTNPEAATGTEGQSLSEIKLSGGAMDVAGTFDWKDGSIKPAVGTSSQVVVFTPQDEANYNAHEFSINVTIQAATTPDSGSPDNSLSVTPPAGTNSAPKDIPLRTTIQDGTASTVVSAADGNKLVKEAVESQSETIVIKPEIASGVTKAEVSIPSSTVRQIQSETNAALTVSTPIADATIPREALDSLSSAGGDVSVAAEQAGQAVVLTLTAGGETVENVPGGLTLTVPAEDAGPGTVAVLVHDDGTREILRRSIAENGKMNIPLNGSATVELVDNSKSFDDVPSTSWASEAITFVSARELFGGTSETAFSPDQTMSRGMVATMLYRLEGQPDQALTSAYSDVGDDDWYAESVAWAAENGIVNGYGDGQFGPNDSVTREQFIVMLWRYVGSPEANDHDLSFLDADQINSYALEALCWAVERGVLGGNDSGQLVPGGTATRAEAAQMLKNFLENT